MKTVHSCVEHYYIIRQCDLAYTKYQLTTLKTSLPNASSDFAAGIDNDLWWCHFEGKEKEG